jgi:ferredoxin
MSEALQKLKRDFIDIFHLHAAREGEPFVKRAQALKRLVRYKEEGTIGAIGISTHFVKVTREAARLPEIDIVFPIINKTGMGIIDGTAEEMAEAIEEAHKAGKGVYIMKAFAGGNLLEDRIGALDYVSSLAGIDSFMIGALRPQEVDYNARYFLGQEIPDELASATAGVTKRLVRIRNCKGCGTCVEVCPTGALKITEEEGMVTIDHSKCILCGYCAPVCPQFALRVV